MGIQKDIPEVIDDNVRQWLEHPELYPFLLPTTLFRMSNF
ncbi:conserved phage C-terminal domain-containing protein [Solibacillus sp. FSL H8-0538]